MPNDVLVHSVKQPSGATLNLWYSEATSNLHFEFVNPNGEGFCMSVDPYELFKMGDIFQNAAIKAERKRNGRE